MYIDTHAHVNFSAFRDDTDEVIARALDGDVDVILVGAEYKSSKRAIDIANRYEKRVYAAVGLHPIHLRDSIEKNFNGQEIAVKREEFNYDAYEKLAKFEKVVAIGEIGLDYFRFDLSEDIEELKKQQKIVFFEQLKLARELDLPVIIHCRQAHDDMMAILTDFKNKFKDLFPKNRPWGVMHCFSGDENLAWDYFNIGLLISFTGIVTFSQQWDALIRKIPLDKFMIETDCPFMTPEPFRGKRNEPLLVKKVAEKIAEIKNISIETIAKATTNNAKNIFKL
jgi:TatD DNase family protein